MNKVSVVVPAYNAGKYLEETLRSIRSQSVKPYEIIVVDDASTDNTERIALRNKARLLTHEVNMGIGCSRQDGAEAAKGNFVAFLSSDDVWNASFLEKSLLWARAGKKRVAVFSDYVRCDQFLNVQSFFKAPWYGNYDAFCRYVVYWALRKNMFVNFSAVLLPRQIFREVKFQSDLRHGEDLIFLLDTILIGLDWVHVPEALLLYRIHGSQGTRVTDEQEWYLLWSYIIDRLRVLVDVDTLRFAYDQSYKTSHDLLLERIGQKVEKLKKRFGLTEVKKSFDDTKNLFLHNRKK